jgi:hypothetical protein
MSDERDDEGVGFDIGHLADDERPELTVLTFPDRKEDVEESVYERTAGDITEQEKVEFLQLSRLGYNRQEIAEHLGYRARPWRAICSPASIHYDEDFANSYAEAKGSPEARLNFLERLRTETTRRAMMDSDRLLEKLMLVHDPDWQVLREKNLSVNIHAILEQRFKDLPTDLLKQLYEAMGGGDDAEVVDGEYRELPPAGGTDGQDQDQ